MADNIPYSIAIPENYVKDGEKNEALELSLDRGLENKMKCRILRPNMIRTTLQEPPTRLSFPNSACHPLYAMKKSSTQTQNFTIRQLWVVSKYLQRMMFLQKHSLMGILTNPSVKEILSANPKSLGHNQNDFFLPAGQSVLFR